jgi:iron complex outermembrane recepter protein
LRDSGVRSVFLAMNHHARSAGLPGRLPGALVALVLLCAVALLSSGRAAPDAPKVAFDLPSGAAERALRQFAEQSGAEVLFLTESATGVVTNTVRGAFTPREAVDRLLAGTPLVARQDERTGAWRIRRDSDPNVPGAVATEAAARPDGPTGTEGGTVRMQRMEVTGSRIRSLVGEADINSVRVFDRIDIEDSGVQSIADLRDLIPELSVARGNSFTGNTGGTSVDGIVNFQLRGLTGNSTLVLVDGRRQPRTRQSGVGSDYDIYGIPVSAIERIEVLSDGGSSIYGADAIGGVVNIILRKNYRATDLEFSYENTWDSDAAVLRSNLSYANRFGKLSFSLRANYETQNAMAAVDRWWTASNDRRFIGGTDARSQIPVGGRIRVATGVFPGTTSNVLAIPAGSDGRTVTAAAFIAAGVPQDADRYNSARYTNLFNESERQAYMLRADYEFRPWLKPMLSARWNEAVNYGKGDALGGSQSLTLPIGYPGNPFNVPIIVEKYYWEYGFQDRTYTTTDLSIQAGISGDLPRGWSYAANLQYMKKKPSIEESINQFSPALFTTAINADPSYRPIITHDSRVVAPNPAGILDRIYFLNPSGEPNWIWTYDVKLDGPVYTLPAGEIMTAVGFDMREDYVRFIRLLPNDTTQAANVSGRRATALFGEVQVPVFGERKNLRFFRSLRLSASGRQDDYGSSGTGRTLAQGASWRPFPWLLLAGNRNEGFKIPLLIEQFRNASTVNTTFGTTGTFVLFDTARNQQLIGPVSRFLGGNPNLLPEESESLTGRIVVDVPFVKGLSLEAKAWDTKIVNQVNTLTQYQDFFTLFPERFSRAAATPADVAAGIPGVINYIDNSPVNLARRQLAGVDYLVTYERNTRGWGRFSVRASATTQSRNFSQIRPGANNLATVGLANRPVRATGTLTWRKGPWSSQVTHIWQDGYRVGITAGPDWPTFTQWNGSVGYDFAKRGLAGAPRWVNRALDRTRLSVAMVNVFEEGFALSPTGGVNPMLDPRLRRYTLTLRKTF